MFDHHLYGDAERIAADLDAIRTWMRAYGCERPIVIGEYGAPTPEQFPEAQSALHATMAATLAGPLGNGAQRIVLMPSLDLVLVMTAGMYNDPGQRQAAAALMDAATRAALESP